MNDSFTYTHGFLPPQPLNQLPDSHRIWDHIAAELPNWLESNQLHVRISKMHLLDASDKSLPEKYLPRAAMILSYIAHGIAFEHKSLQKQGTIQLPNCLEVPWQQITKRLARPFPTLSIYDTVLNNWKISDPEKQSIFLKNPSLITLEDLKPQICAFNDRGETIFHLSIVEMELKAIPAIQAIHDILDLTLKDEKDFDKIKDCLEKISFSIDNIRKAFAKVSPKPSSVTFVDPLIWVNTLAIFTQGFYQGNVGMSGLAVPSFHLLDGFFGRKKFDSELGVAILKYRPLFGKRQFDFITQVSQAPIETFVSINQSAKDLYNQSKRKYDAFLDFHETKVMGYLTMMPFSQRQATNSGISFKQKPVHLEAKRELRSSRIERFGDISPKTIEPSEKKPVLRKFSIVEVAEHNNKQKGYWLIINNNIYELNRFVDKHPGGDKILRLYAGLDATQHFMTVHQGQLLANTILSKYKIGEIEIDESKPYIGYLNCMLYEIIACENILHIVDSYDPIHYTDEKVLFGAYNIAISKLESIYKTIKSPPDNVVLNIEQLLRLDWVQDYIYKRIIDQYYKRIKFNLNQINNFVGIIKSAVISTIHADSNLGIESYFSKIDIAIIGCGLSGLILAIFLSKKHQYKVTVFEALPKSQISLRSFNITLSERGLDSLESVGLKEIVMSMCSPVKGRIIHRTDTSVYNLTYGIKDSESLYSIRRIDLIEILLKEARSLGVNFNFNMECGNYNFKENRFKAFDNHRKLAIQFEAKLIFGADGVHSSFRQHFTKIPSFYLSENSKQKSDIIYTEFRLRYQGRLDRLHIWPRANSIIIAFPNKDGTFTFSLFIKNDVKIDLNFFKINYPNLLSFFEPDFLQKLNDIEFKNMSGSLYEVRFFPWAYQNKALLFGDSAHAFYPFYGQATNGIFEGAKELSRLIDKYGEENWEKIFEEFQEKRKTDIGYISTLANKHAEFLFKELEDENYLRTDQIGKQITKMFPSIMPVYNLISFTILPYSKAISIGKHHEMILAKIMEIIQKKNLSDVSQAELEKLIKETVFKFNNSSGFFKYNEAKSTNLENSKCNIISKL